MANTGSANSTQINTNKKALLNALEKSLGIVSTACKNANIDRTTFYNYLDSDIEFKKQVKEIQETVNDFAESKLYKLINDENPAGIIFYLKTKGKSRGYSEKIEIETDQTKQVNHFLPSTKVSRVFIDTYHSIGKYRIIVDRGGTRSGKTYSITQILVQWLKTGTLNELNDVKVVSIVRKTSPSLKRSVLRDIETIIADLEFNPKHNKTDRFFEFEGRILEYFSVDSHDKVKGAKRDVLYINEANELHFEEFRQLNIRTKYCTILDLNPDDDTGWIPVEIEGVRANTEKDVRVIVSTFMDNYFLDKETQNEINKLRSDPEYWQVFGLGQYATLTGLAYSDWQEYVTLPARKKFIKQYAIDFGFNPDPTAILEQNFNTSEKEVYEKELAYDIELTSKNIADILKTNGYNGEVVICDAAEKREIAELNDFGINAYPGSKQEIIFGVKKSKEFKRFVHIDSTNLKMELRRYKKLKDPNTGNFMNKYIDAFNHLLDASRYSILHFIKDYSYLYTKEK